MKGTPLTEDAYHYIVDLFATEQQAMLERMSARAKTAGMPMIMIGEEQAKFVAFFLKAIEAKTVLDVGTLFGFSAATMAKAIGEAGEVVSLEFSELHAKVAAENLYAEGISNVTILQGPALESMQRLEANTFDFILIDADKANYVNYLQEAIRLVRNGGVIAGDNALAWGKIAKQDLAESDEDYKSVTSVRAFNRAFADESRIFGCIVPIGDGMAMGTVMK